MKRIIFVVFFMLCSAANAQAWRNCVPNSIGPGGCDSIGPGGDCQSALGVVNPLAREVDCQSVRRAVNQLVPEEVNQSVRKEGKPSTEIGRRDSTQIRCAHMTITVTPVVELATDRLQNYMNDLYFTGFLVKSSLFTL